MPSDRGSTTSTQVIKTWASWPFLKRVGGRNWRGHITIPTHRMAGLTFREVPSPSFCLPDTSGATVDPLEPPFVKFFFSSGERGSDEHLYQTLDLKMGRQVLDAARAVRGGWCRRFAHRWVRPQSLRDIALRFSGWVARSLLCEDLWIGCGARRFWSSLRSFDPPLRFGAGG